MNKPENYYEINELVSRILDLKKKSDKGEETFNFANIISTILNTPTIKIVRCKDCKHCKKWDNYDSPQYTCTMWTDTCTMWTDQWDMPTDPNGYCHYGKIKES